MVRSKSGWILVLPALLPVAACDVDRTEDDALPEAEDSRLPGYEVTYRTWTCTSIARRTGAGH